jgi:hypothetical protein
MSDEDQIRERVREAFKQGYKAAEKDIPLEKVLDENKGASA